MTITEKIKEPEITVDTLGPVPVAPPTVETDSIAVPVIAVDTTYSASTTSQAQKPATCTVIAPAALGPGYTFTANVDGIDFLVTVPAGGVTEGQAFQVPYPTTPHDSQAVTAVHGGPPPVRGDTGAPKDIWRNGVWDCFEVLCDGMFWQGWCCTPILLGQVMTRFKLNLCGTGTMEKYEYTFWILTGLWVLFLIIFFTGYLYWLALVWLIFITIIGMNTRFYIRQKYDIPVTNCDGCCDGCCDGMLEDCCCAFWCSCCVTIQMARHSHFHHDYPYQCCTTNGLPSGVPEV
jgi:hypothetical protein